MATATKKEKKEKKKLTLGRLALVVGTQQTLSNLFWDFQYLCLGLNNPKCWHIDYINLSWIFQNDGTVVTQLTDFRMQSQITRILILGEEELDQPRFQVFGLKIAWKYITKEKLTGT